MCRLLPLLRLPAYIATQQYSSSPSSLEPGSTTIGPPPKPFSCAIVQWLAQAAFIVVVLEGLLEVAKRRREHRALLGYGGHATQWAVHTGGEPLLVGGRQAEYRPAGEHWDAPPAYEEEEPRFTPRGGRQAPQWPGPQHPNPEAEGKREKVSTRAEGEGEVRQEGEGRTDIAEAKRAGQQGEGEVTERKRGGEGDGGEAGLTGPLVLMSPADDAPHARLISPRAAFVPRVMLDLGPDHPPPSGGTDSA